MPSATNPIAVPNLFPRIGASRSEKAVSFLLDFTPATPTAYIVNPLLIQTQELFGVPRTVYVDNSNGSAVVQIQCTVTNMSIDVPPFSQGIMPISCVSNSNLIFTSQNNANAQCFVELYNYEQRALIWSTVGPFIPGQVTGVDGEDESTIMSPVNPLSVAPKDCETVAYGRKDLAATGASQAIVAAQGVANFITLTNAGDLTGAGPGAPAYISVGGAAAPEAGRFLGVGQTVTLPYRTKLAITGTVDAAGSITSILYEIAH